MKFSLNARGLLLAVFSLLILVSSGELLAQKGLQKALKTQRMNNGKLFENSDVVATGVSADENGDAIIKVFMRGDKAGIPKSIDVIKLKKVDSGAFRAGPAWKPQAKGGGKGKPGGGDTSDDPKTRFARPVPIGVSVGSTGPNYCFAGTLGCRLVRMNFNNGTMDRFILSNNHVLAEENAGQVGSDLIIQPGTLDNDCVLDFNDVIGTLFDFEPIRFAGQTNLIDAAIASTTAANTGFASPTSADGAPTSTTSTATVGMLVKKYGRTTGYTEGVVDSINVTVNVAYDGGTATFTNQVVITGRQRKGRRYVSSTFSDSGDSGSLIVNQDSNNPVGLLFAGNTSFTIANPINAVLDNFSEPNNGIMFFVDDGN